MRPTIVLLAAALWCGSVQAQVPRQINYQGYLTTPGNAPVNGAVVMALRLYNVATGGAPLYSETQTVTVANGEFGVLIGAVTPLALPFDGPYYLGITVGADAEMTPRQPLAATPYALRAASTDTLDKLEVSGGGIISRGNWDQTQRGALFINAQKPSIRFSEAGGYTGAVSNDWLLHQSFGAFRVFENTASQGTPTWSERLTLAPGGNVGVGTASPTSKLEIAAQDGLKITGFQPFLTLQDTNGANQKSVIQGANGSLFFYPHSFQGLPAPMMLNNGTGNVGIGTTTPSSKLTVEGPGDPLLRINHTGESGAPALWLQQDGTPKAFIWWNPNGNSISFGTPNSNPILELFDGYGARIQGGTYMNGDVTLNGKLFLGSSVAGSFGNPVGACIDIANARRPLGYCTSSLRYKTGVRSFTGGLDIVNRLRAISFTWASDGGSGDIGLAAEEVAQVEPLLTFRNEQGEIEGVKYNQLSAVFITAFQEQQAQLEQQRLESQQKDARIAAFEKEVAELKREASANKSVISELTRKQSYLQVIAARVEALELKLKHSVQARVEKSLGANTAELTP